MSETTRREGRGLLTRAARRRGQRGAITPLVAASAMVLVFFLIAQISIGQLAIMRDEQQNSVDAVAMMAARIAQKEGVGAVCNHPALLALMGGNSSRPGTLGCPQSRVVPQPDGSSRLVFDARVDGRWEANFGPPRPDDDPHNIQLVASTEIVQNTFNQVEQRLPKLVLVLDYSGSMSANFGGISRIQSLRNAVNGLLDQRLRAEYGMVMFSSNVLETVTVAHDDVQPEIRGAIRRNPGGATNYQAPIDTATGLLTREDNTGYYILFITDGFPNEGGDAVQAANRARSNDVTVFTLNIGGGAAQRNLLISMSGGPGDPGNPAYYFTAGNDAQLQATFRQIVSGILCGIGPLMPPPDPDLPPTEVYAFLVDRGGREMALPYTNDLVSNAGRFGYHYRRDENKLRLTERTCDAVLDEGAHIVARYGMPKLVQ